MFNFLAYKYIATGSALVAGLPDYGIECPFDHRVNHLASSLEKPKDTNSFVNRLELFARSVALQQKFCHANFSDLTAGAYARLDNLGHLQIADDFVAWLFVHDDYRESAAQTLLPQDIATFNQVLAEFFSGLRVPTQSRALVNLDNPQRLALQQSMFNLYMRLSQIGDFGYVTFSLKQYFQANKWEARNRQHASIPAHSEFVSNRRHTSAVTACVTLSCFLRSGGKNLKTEISDDVFLSGMLNDTADIIGLVNDVFSFGKEVREGIVENYVLVWLFHKIGAMNRELQNILFPTQEEEFQDLRRAFMQHIFDRILQKESAPSTGLTDLDSQRLSSALDRIKELNINTLLGQAIGATVSVINDLTRSYLSKKVNATDSPTKTLVAECCEDWIASNLAWSRATFRYVSESIQTS
ncbi:MAG: terpene synthase family protein [Candidatus Margulisiibacteriota bacterium]